MVLITEQGGTGDYRTLGAGEQKELLHLMPVTGAWPHMYSECSACVHVCVPVCVRTRVCVLGFTKLLIARVQIFSHMSS